VSEFLVFNILCLTHRDTINSSQYGFGKDQAKSTAAIGQVEKESQTGTTTTSYECSTQG
jgi:hypothetical protein